MSSKITDKKGRTLLHISKNGKVALSRYEDLSEQEVQNLAETYCEITGEDNTAEILNFLRFQEDNEKFCS